MTATKIAAAILVAVVAVVAVWWSGPWRVRAGDVFEDVRAGYVHDAEVGTRFTDVYATFRFKDPEAAPVIITDLQMLGDFTEGVEVVDLSVADNVGFSRVVLLRDPPAPRVRREYTNVRPAIGATVEPPTGDVRRVTIMATVEVTEPGRWTRDGYRVRYVQNGRTYVEDMLYEALVCTPEGFVDEQCTVAGFED